MADERKVAHYPHPHHRCANQYSFALEHCGDCQYTLYIISLTRYLSLSLPHYFYSHCSLLPLYEQSYGGRLDQADAKYCSTDY